MSHRSQPNLPSTVSVLHCRQKPLKRGLLPLLRISLKVKASMSHRSQPNLPPNVSSQSADVSPHFLRSRSMHYERAPRFRRSKLDVAPPPLRCAVQWLRSATAALGGNCGGMSSAKELQ